MKKGIAFFLSIVLLCTSFLTAAAETWRPYDPADMRDWQSQVDGIRFDGYPEIGAIDLNGRISDLSTCTKSPVSVYCVGIDGELYLCTTMLFSIYEPGVLIPRESYSDGLNILDAEEFILRSDSGVLFDDVEEISFTARSYFYGVRELNYELYIPLNREPMLVCPMSDSETVQEMWVRFSNLYGPAYPALFDTFDPSKTLIIDVCRGDEIIKSVTVVPTAFDPRTAEMTVRLQDGNGVNFHDLICYEQHGDNDATASHWMYSYRLHVPEGLLLCGTVKNEETIVDDCSFVGLNDRVMSIDLPAWFFIVRRITKILPIGFVRNALEAAASYVISVTMTKEADFLMQSYHDIGGTQSSAFAVFRTLLFHS